MHFKSQLFLLPVLLGSVCAAPTPSKDDATLGPIVITNSGPVVGTTTIIPSAGAVVNKFLGIPFAASPPERFSPPADPKKWLLPLEATKLKPACIQQFVDPAFSRNETIAIFNNPALPESEDCLYLNVWAPATPPPVGGRAVLFWVFGGDLQFGSGSVAIYDGTSFAANQDVVLVTHNYRTNVFGFSNSPQIPTGSQNAGFLDQRKALEWVQENIRAFGGDPTKVTIFGESAGGWSVKQLVANPPDPLTFRAAIMESEAVSFTGNSSADWDALLVALGCSTAASPIDCARAAPAATIKNIIETQILSFAPVSDMVTSVSPVNNAITSGTAAKVPLLLGSNAEEGRVFAFIDGLEAPGATLAPFLESILPGDPADQAALAAFYESLFPTPYEQAAAIITDSSFTCPISTLASLASDNGFLVWRYFFNATFPNTQVFPDAGVYHSSEIPEVFGTFPTVNETAQEVALSRFMQTAWAKFAKDPEAGPGWPQLGTNNGIELGDLGGIAPDGETTIAQASVETRCFIYAAAIAATGV